MDCIGALFGSLSFIFSDQNYVCFKLNCRELREELHKPPLKMKELKDSDVVWLNQRFSQSSLKLSVLSFCMMDRLMFVQRVGGRS